MNNYESGVIIKNYKTFLEAKEKMETQLTWYEGEVRNKINDISERFAIVRNFLSFFQRNPFTASTFGRRVVQLILNRVLGVIINRIFTGHAEENWKTKLQERVKLLLHHYKTNMAAFVTNIFYRRRP